MSGIMLATLGADLLPAYFVASAQEAGTSLPSSLGARGLLAGDLMLVLARNPTTVVSDSGGAWIAQGNVSGGGVGNGRVYTRYATSGDLAGTITASAADGFIFASWRSSTALTKEVYYESTGNPVSIPGISPSGRTIGLIGCALTADNIPISFSGPATWTLRENMLADGFRMIVYDRLNPAEPYYVPGTNITVANPSSGGAGSVGTGVFSMQI